MNRLPPLTTLPAFVAAAKFSSISKAAEQLCVTHSAVSQAIKHLENALETKLFDRSHRQIRLTTAGANLLPFMEQALQQIKMGAKQLERDKHNNLITVNMSTSLATTWFVDQIAGFETEYPLYQLGINTPGYSVDFELETIDCAIYRCQTPPKYLQHLLLFEEQHFIVCKPGYLATNISLPQALATVPLISTNTESFVNQWQQFCDAAQLTLPNDHNVLQYNNPLLALQAAKNGLGLALSNRLLTQQMIDDRLLTPAFEQRIASSYAYYLVYSNNHPDKKKIRCFAAWLQGRIVDSCSVV